MGRYWVGVIILLLTLIGIAANCVLTAAIYSGWKALNSQFNTRPIISLTFASYLFLFTNLAVSIPHSLSHPNYSNDVLIALSSNNTVSYFCYQFGLLYIAVERFFVFYAPKINSNSKLSIIPLLLIWLLSILMTVVPTYYGCHKTWNDEILSFTFECTNDWNTFYMTTGQICIGTILVIYIAIIARVLKLRQCTDGNTSNFKKNASLVVQFFSVFLISWLSLTLFMVLSMVVTGASVWISMINSAISTISVSSNAIIMLKYNSSIRSALLGSLNPTSNAVTILNTTNARRLTTTF